MACRKKKRKNKTTVGKKKELFFTSATKIKTVERTSLTLFEAKGVFFVCFVFHSKGFIKGDLCKIFFFFAKRKKVGFFFSFEKSFVQTGPIFLKALSKTFQNWERFGNLSTSSRAKRVNSAFFSLFFFCGVDMYYTGGGGAEEQKHRWQWWHRQKEVGGGVGFQLFVIT